MVYSQQIKKKKKMKYSLITPELEGQISEIRQRIRLSMNGIVSDRMIQSGIIYKKNFGVSIPRIKEIASFYSLNHNLAQRLWSLHIRETMIMATLLEPIDKFTRELAQEWVEDFNQIEIVEQTTMNLFCKLPFAPLISCEWVKSDKIWIQITGFILAARITEKLNQKEMAAIIKKAMEMSATKSFHLYKAVALCLCRLCRNDKETAKSILKEMDRFATTSSIAQQFISNEVKQQILFLDIL